jgi:GNAT superfamily N-acetyltransferase
MGTVSRGQEFDRGIGRLRHPEGKGEIAYHNDGAAVRVWDIQVPKEHRRQGVASQMMDALRERFPDHDIETGHYTPLGKKWARGYEAKRGWAPEVVKGYD